METTQNSSALGQAPVDVLTKEIWGLRETGKQLTAKTKELMNRELEDKCDVGEFKANVMLAVRHFEDAVMRLGKVLQAKDGGKSIYPH